MMQEPQDPKAAPRHVTGKEESPPSPALNPFSRIGSETPLPNEIGPDGVRFSNTIQHKVRESVDPATGEPVFGIETQDEYTTSELLDNLTEGFRRLFAFEDASYQAKVAKEAGIQEALAAEQTLKQQQSVQEVGEALANVPAFQGARTYVYENQQYDQAVQQYIDSFGDQFPEITNRLAANRAKRNQFGAIYQDAARVARQALGLAASDNVASGAVGNAASNALDAMLMGMIHGGGSRADKATAQFLRDVEQMLDGIFESGTVEGAQEAIAAVEESMQPSAFTSITRTARRATKPVVDSFMAGPQGIAMRWLGGGDQKPKGTPLEFGREELRYALLKNVEDEFVQKIKDNEELSEDAKEFALRRVSETIGSLVPVGVSLRVARGGATLAEKGARWLAASGLAGAQAAAGLPDSSVQIKQMTTDRDNAVLADLDPEQAQQASELLDRGTRFAMGFALPGMFAAGSQAVRQLASRPLNAALNRMTSGASQVIPSAAQRALQGAGVSVPVLTGAQIVADVADDYLKDAVGEGGQSLELMDTPAKTYFLGLAEDVGKGDFSAALDRTWEYLKGMGPEIVAFAFAGATRMVMPDLVAAARRRGVDVELDPARVEEVAEQAKREVRKVDPEALKELLSREADGPESFEEKLVREALGAEVDAAIKSFRESVLGVERSPQDVEGMRLQELEELMYPDRPPQERSRTLAEARARLDVADQSTPDAAADVQGQGRAYDALEAYLKDPTDENLRAVYGRAQALGDQKQNPVAQMTEMGARFDARAEDLRRARDNPDHPANLAVIQSRLARATTAEARLKVMDELPEGVQVDTPYGRLERLSDGRFRRDDGVIFAPRRSRPQAAPESTRAEDPPLPTKEDAEAPTDDLGPSKDVVEEAIRRYNPESGSIINPVDWIDAAVRKVVGKNRRLFGRTAMQSFYDRPGVPEVLDLARSMSGRSAPTTVRFLDQVGSMANRLPGTVQRVEQAMLSRTPVFTRYRRVIRDLPADLKTEDLRARYSEFRDYASMHRSMGQALLNATPEARKLRHSIEVMKRQVSSYEDSLRAAQETLDESPDPSRSDRRRVQMWENRLKARQRVLQAAQDRLDELREVYSREQVPDILGEPYLKRLDAAVQKGEQPAVQARAAEMAEILREALDARRDSLSPERIEQVETLIEVKEKVAETGVDEAAILASVTGGIAHTRKNTGLLRDLGLAETDARLALSRYADAVEGYVLGQEMLYELPVGRERPVDLSMNEHLKPANNIVIGRGQQQRRARSEGVRYLMPDGSWQRATKELSDEGKVVWVEPDGHLGQWQTVNLGDTTAGKFLDPPPAPMQPPVARNVRKAWKSLQDARESGDAKAIRAAEKAHREAAKAPVADKFEFMKPDDYAWRAEIVEGGFDAVQRDVRDIAARIGLSAGRVDRALKITEGRLTDIRNEIRRIERRVQRSGIALGLDDDVGWLGEFGRTASAIGNQLRNIYVIKELGGLLNGATVTGIAVSGTLTNAAVLSVRPRLGPQLRWSRRMIELSRRLDQRSDLSLDPAEFRQQLEQEVFGKQAREELEAAVRGDDQKASLEAAVKLWQVEAMMTGQAAAQRFTEPALWRTIEAIRRGGEQYARPAPKNFERAGQWYSKVYQLSELFSRSNGVPMLRDAMRQNPSMTSQQAAEMVASNLVRTQGGVSPLSNMRVSRFLSNVPLANWATVWMNWAFVMSEGAWSRLPAKRLAVAGASLSALATGLSLMGMDPSIVAEPWSQQDWAGGDIVGALEDQIEEAVGVRPIVPFPIWVTDFGMTQRLAEGAQALFDVGREMVDQVTGAGVSTPGSFEQAKAKLSKAAWGSLMPRDVRTIERTFNPFGLEGSGARIAADGTLQVRVEGKTAYEYPPNHPVARMARSLSESTGVPLNSVVAWMAEQARVDRYSTRAEMQRKNQQRDNRRARVLNSSQAEAREAAAQLHRGSEGAMSEWNRVSMQMFDTLLDDNLERGVEDPVKAAFDSMSRRMASAARFMLKQTVGSNMRAMLDNMPTDDEQAFLADSTLATRFEKLIEHVEEYNPGDLTFYKGVVYFGSQDSEFARQAPMILQSLDDVDAMQQLAMRTLLRKETLPLDLRVKLLDRVLR